jgi:hypothetical protein
LEDDRLVYRRLADHGLLLDQKLFPRKGEIMETISATLPDGRIVTFTDRFSMRRGHTPRRMKLTLNMLQLPPVTLPVDWTKNWSLQFPIDLNDQLGDCMYAAGCHIDNAWTGNVGTESSFDLTAMKKCYEQLSGGDNGLDEGSLVQGWQKGLCNVAAANIIDHLDIDTTNVQLMQTGIYLFGGVLFMLAVPDSWISNFNSSGGSVWDAPAKADERNGHGVALVGVDANGRYRLLTWGSFAWLTTAGLKVCDPSGFIPFSLRWFNAQGYAPNGLHYTELAPLWVAMGGDPLPPSTFPPPTQPPVPVPPNVLSWVP